MSQLLELLKSKTIVAGIAGLIVSLLAASGVIEPEGKTELAEQIMEFVAQVAGALGALASLLAIFTRVAIKKTEQEAKGAATAAKRAENAQMAMGEAKINKLGLFLLCAFMLPMLSACTAGSKLGEIITNPDGKPVVSGIICVNTPQGQFCYVPEGETIVKPETVPEGAPAVPALALAPAGPAPVPPPVPQLAK